MIIFYDCRLHCYVVGSCCYLPSNSQEWCSNFQKNTKELCEICGKRMHRKSFQSFHKHVGVSVKLSCSKDGKHFLSYLVFFLFFFFIYVYCWYDTEREFLKNLQMLFVLPTFHKWNIPVTVLLFYIKSLNSAYYLRINLNRLKHIFKLV